MKKTKIILPAIALLAVSGIASVTGTVAWFTASQATELTASNISAISTSGDLTAKIKAGTGVSTPNVAEGSEGAGFIDGNAFALYDLCDASYDAVNNQLYKAVMDSDNDGASNTVTGYTAISNGQASSWVKDSQTLPVYYAAQWSVTFETAASYGSYDIFFDARSANSNLAGTNDIFKSFRVAMKCGSELIVWAPNGSSTSNKYVSGTSATSTYTAGTNFLAGSSSDHWTSATAQDTATSDITHLASGLTASTSKTVDFVAWFEGTDANCVTDKANNVANVAASTLKMAFYAVSWTTGA